MTAVFVNSNEGNLPANQVASIETSLSRDCKVLHPISVANLNPRKQRRYILSAFPKAIIVPLVNYYRYCTQKLSQPKPSCVRP